MPWRWTLTTNPEVRTGERRTPAGVLERTVTATLGLDTDKDGPYFPSYDVVVVDADGAELGHFHFDADDSRQLRRELAPAPGRRGAVEAARTRHTWDGSGSPGPNDSPMQRAFETYADSLSALIS